jgi:4-amino-4-deoxy-L-arabinose transferase-like glycosyltransferase
MLSNPRTATLLLIAVATLLRLGWCAALEPATDEAYHWQYARHPELSYFDHPPMTMLAIRAGIAACGGWVHPLSLRLGFIFLCAGSTWILFRWTSRSFGDRAGFWAATGFTLTYYFTSYGGTFAMPDSPLLFFALLTWWQAGIALDDRESRGARLRAWLLTGVGFGGAMLSKYHGILLPAGVVAYALITPGQRRVLATPGPYLAVLIGAVMFMPVIVWNAQNEWASFKFQGGRAASGDVPVLHGGPLVWLVGPILLLFPWIWFWLVGELLRRLGRFPPAGPERFCVVLAVAPLLFFFVSSCFNGMFFPHWPLLGFVPLYPLVGARWASLRVQSPRTFAVIVSIWIGGAVLILNLQLLQARTGIIPVPPTVDVTKAYSGWNSVADELDSRGLLDDPDLFLFTNQWDHSGELAFAIRNRRPVTCYHSFDARGFAFWSKPEDYLGRTGLLVVIDEKDEALTRKEYELFFERMTVAAEFPMMRGSQPFLPVKVYRCENQRAPYPFDFMARHAKK